MSLSARNIIGSARVRVVTEAPYFSCAVFKLRPVERPGYGTVGVDAGGRLWYDPAIVQKWGSVHTAGAIYHEVNHLLRRHHERCGSRSPMRWNVAADLEINDTIANTTFKLPEFTHPKDPSKKSQGLHPEMFGLKKGELAETYYRELPDDGGGNGNGDSEGDGDEGEAKSRPAPGHGDCGGCAGNPRPEDGEGADTGGSGGGKSDDSIPEPLSPGELEVMRKKVAEDITSHVRKSRGTVPGSLRNWAEEELKPPKVDYMKAFSKMVRGSVSQAAGRVDYTYAKLGRSYAARRAVMGSKAPITPAMHRPVPNVALVADTSGSMGSGTDSPLYHLMCEVRGVVRALGSPVRVFATDAAVGACVNVFSRDDVCKIAGYGGGGTDMRVGIKAADESRPRPSAVVVITDGETPWPGSDEMPKSTLIVVLIGDGAPEPPEHIRNVLRVPVDEVRRS